MNKSEKTMSQRMSRTEASPAINDGPRQVLAKVAETTSLHGIPNVYRAHTSTRKAVWSALCMAGLG